MISSKIVTDCSKPSENNFILFYSYFFQMITVLAKLLKYKCILIQLIASATVYKIELAVVEEIKFLKI